MMLRPLLTALASLLCLGCEADRGAEPALATQSAAPAPAAVCEVVERGLPLPQEVRETSGLARSPAGRDHFWTHNDAGNDAEIYAVDPSGALLGRARLAGVEAIDWEDIAAAPCDEGACLFVADIGDNDAERAVVTVYRVPEPEPASGEPVEAVALHARFPDGAQDAEAFFVLPGGDAYLVTKGRHGPIVLYRYPLLADGVATLERVRELFPEPQDNEDRATAASASPDGRWVGIRTYRTLYLYDAGELTGGGEAEPIVVDLTPLGEAQGEGVVIAADGTVWVASEAGNRRDVPRLSRMRCTLPDE